MESNARTTGSTAAPQNLGPRPTPPSQKLTARPVAHDLDWDHIPTARAAAGSYTREKLDRAIADHQQDEPRPYDRELLGLDHEYDRPFAHGCF